jgi:DNA-binding response OmpR family regulator
MLNETVASAKLKPTVLVIDDSSSFRQYVGDVLLSQNYEVHSAENGREGLALIKSEQPDVVLLDIEMPVMDGMEVLETLKPYRRNFAIIVLTSLASENKRLAGFEAGADDYITKPFNDAELKARVKVGLRISQSKKELEQVRDRMLDLMYKFECTIKMAREEKKRANTIRMLSGIAHHINNPLSFIRSNINMMSKYVRILKEGFELIAESGVDRRKGSKEREDGLERVIKWTEDPNVLRIRADMAPVIEETKEGIDRISHIVKRLMQLEDAGIKCGNGLVDIKDCLLRSIHTRDDMHAGVIESINICEDEMLVYGNDGEIHAAIDNIIENALDSVTAEGNVSVSLYECDGCALLEISDTGKGIADKDIEMIFNPFFTTKGGPFKLGLGLTVAQYFIKASDGDIEIDSQESKGTVVRIRFPLQNSEIKADSIMKGQP